MTSRQSIQNDLTHLSKRSNVTLIHSILIDIPFERPSSPARELATLRQPGGRYSVTAKRQLLGAAGFFFVCASEGGQAAAITPQVETGEMLLQVRGASRISGILWGNALKMRRKRKTQPP